MHDQQGPGHRARRESVTGHNTYDDTGSITDFTMPGTRRSAATPHQVFTDNDWTHLLASTAGDHLHRRAGGHPGPARLPVHDQARVPDHPGEPHLRPGLSATSARATATRRWRSSAQTITPNAHALADDFGLFDNFYDEGTLSADGHNWIVQADANDYIEKEFGAFYRSYPAQGGDALAYQRDGFIWNAAEAAGQTAKAYGEYNNFITEQAPVPPGRRTTRTPRSSRARPPGRCRCRIVG